ncbi:WPP domain-associated protein-like protein [Carex littledalei]|uniref:WPP domain-associated protein-like protein n=1 Tax=Carex littledalei TaxID=544730 RepID=A0A833VEG6_9POAL|nr:WPP domain-associated protein-like protein [Carex littledalei]
MERIPSAPDKSGMVSIDKSSTLPCTNFTYPDNISHNGSELFHKFDLDEDSYWQGLNNGFQSTLVGSKERNMPISYPSSDKSSENFIDDLVQLFSDAKDCLNSLHSTVQNHIQILKEGIKNQNSENVGKIGQQLNGVERSLQSGLEKIRDMFELISSSVYDLNLVQQFHGEIINLTTRDCFRAVKDDFEARLCKQRSVIKALNKHWQEKVQELDFMQKDLHELLKLLLNSESNNKTDNPEDRIISKFKDNVRMGSIEDFLSAQKEENGEVMDDNFQKSLTRPENRDFSHVKFMTKEEIIKYFKSEMINMRRQHDLILSKKTEELFRYKREVPKGLLFVRKDKEFESLRKRITDIISKLDEIRSKKIEVFVVSTDQDEISRLKCKAESLYYENQHLKKVILDTNKEVKKLSYQLSNKNVKIEKIRGECEELEIEGRIRDEMYNTILRKVVDECSKKMESMNEKFGAVLVGCQKERSSLEKNNLEKDKSLLLANEENKKLQKDMNKKCADILANCQNEISSLQAMVVEKEQQQALANEEKKKLMEAMNEKCRSILVNCQKERSSLEATILEKEKALVLANQENNRLKRTVHSFLTSTEEGQNLVENNSENKWVICENDSSASDDNLGCIITSMLNLSKKFSETEAKLSKNINRSENRLEGLSKECKPLAQQAASMRKNGTLNQEILDVTRTELHNAESEVNVLGKEVDALLRLLQKIYITINRYSPILQYHPELLGAFMKTCNLVTSLRSNRMQM